ncbi:MAG: hypothetical protein IJV26_08690, partial [Lachnospiraceae bacterium]|nr:hypothetical protein [Lachnospiraceae bacterium]
AGAYAHPEVHRYIRKTCLKKGEGVEISDHYEGTLPCLLSLMTYETPEIVDGAENSVCIRIGSLAEMTLQGVQDVRVEECPINDARLSIVWKHACWRILARMTDHEFRAIIS